jgi:hypothetical protein
MAGVTVQEILQRHWEAFRDTHPLPGYVVRAAERMRDCRTAALGGHVKTCRCGRLERVWYNSCKHRSCPQCAYLDMEKWLARQEARLLDCHHYHVVFTVPSELNDLWRYNRRGFADLLFHTVRDTLVELLGDDKYLGALPGMLLALHTWGKSLIAHPHIHCLLTGGGLTADGQWRQVRRRCLLPRKVLMHKFRGKLLAQLRRSVERGQLEVPPMMRRQPLLNLLNKLGRKAWNVKILERYDHGRGVITYLARYLRGGPISNKRLLSCREGRVSFCCPDNHDLDEGGRPRPKTLSLPVDEFLARLLEHVPLPGTQAVRNYGLYAGVKRDELACCRELLGQPPAEIPEALTAEEALARLPDRTIELCPECGEPAVYIRPLPGSRDPPCRNVA